jgi:hypothetical protein
MYCFPPPLPLYRCHLFAASFWNHAPNLGAGLSLGSVTIQKMTGSYTKRSNRWTTGSFFAAWRATKAGMVVFVVLSH